MDLSFIMDAEDGGFIPCPKRPKSLKQVVAALLQTAR